MYNEILSAETITNQLFRASLNFFFFSFEADKICFRESWVALCQAGIMTSVGVGSTGLSSYQAESSSWGTQSMFSDV